ncbi:16S rRNA (uracil(1498)-N(3))-methyltransferase [Jeotgalibaca sp. A127]|uniref:16S rRNA (uracil(1498)-N(3))-methyltransferase n=1 Tax=Jeotgalibaca sp. A127 TaxID=3457324 RepID=UPI003FD28889
MQRYIIKESLQNFTNESIQLDEDNFHHMKNVMRFKPGTKVYLTDATGYSCVGRIIGFSERKVELEWVADETRTSEMPVEVTIACGLSKNDKLELIIQKATELGVHKIIPFPSKHSVVKWDADKMEKKLVRFERIAQEAAEQSHRQHVPKIEKAMTLSELVSYGKDYQHKLVAYEENAKEGEYGVFAQTLTQLQPTDKILIIFGPEGGLDPSEITTLESAGFSTCSLGPRILRTETAPLYALAAISYQTELLK